MRTDWDLYWTDESNRDSWLKPGKEVIELIATLDRTRVKDVLDLGCGPGRHTLSFAEAGFNVTAVDSSQEALDILQKQVSEKEFDVKIVKGSYLEQLFPEKSFDLVIAFNVIYHGTRENMISAIHRIYGWLRPTGIFFFTCPSRRDDRCGDGEEIAPNTYRNSTHPEDIHYYANEADLAEFLHKFRRFSKDVYEHYQDNNGIRRLISHWQIYATK